MVFETILSVVLIISMAYGFRTEYHHFNGWFFLFIYILTVSKTIFLYFIIIFNYSSLVNNNFKSLVKSRWLMINIPFYVKTLTLVKYPLILLINVFMYNIKRCYHMEVFPIPYLSPWGLLCIVLDPYLPLEYRFLINHAIHFIKFKYSIQLIK